MFLMIDSALRTVGWLLTFAIVTGCIVLPFWLYEPIPDGYSDTSARKLHAALMEKNLIKLIGSISEFTGFSTRINVTRMLSGRLTKMRKIPDDPEVLKRDETFNGVPVQIYQPVVSLSSNNNDSVENGSSGGINAVRGGFVYFHSGGWVLGNIDQSDAMVTLMCKLTGVVFVSVEYRLAPEHPFPAAHDDSVTTTKYFIQHAHDYNVDPQRIAVGGDSAGGNLAATVCLRLRDERHSPSLSLQVLLYPPLQIANFRLPSMLAHARGPMLDLRSATRFRALYAEGNDANLEVYLRNDHVSSAAKQIIGAKYVNLAWLPPDHLKGYTLPSDEAGDELIWSRIKNQVLSPYLAPLMANDLSDLPRAYLLTCEHDVLRDDGYIYVHRLRVAGNNVTHVNSQLGFHGIIGFSVVVPEVRAMLVDVVEFIKTHL